MQREVNLTDPVAGVVQVIKNTADARIWGFEADFSVPIAEGVVLDGSLTIEQVLPVIGRSTLRVSYAYRDASAYTDNNRGTLNELNRIDASLAIKVFDDRGTVTLFGQNLTNNAQIGSDTQLPSTLGGVALGGTFAPLSKGRVFGIELRISD